MKIQMSFMDAFKYYGSKVLAYAILIGIGTTAFAALVHADSSAYYKSTTTHKGY
tara:strand:- start:69 stop:230 length:162 start_codon:yes stop_codon:yes gene_type:complete